MNAALQWMPAGFVWRMFLGGLAVTASLLFAMPGAAQEAHPGAAGSAQGTSLPSNVPVKREHSGDGATPLNDVRWIAIVLAMGLIATAVFIARRRARPAASTCSTGSGTWRKRFAGLLDAVPSHEIQRVSSTPLSPRHSLHVVVWNGRRLLLGCTDQSIKVLAETSSAPDIPQPIPSHKEDVQ
ncbi:hypothetical protein J2W35_006485 [Variovorax boronicumulans]|uniref:flagellar biosynthetic protein FliO n=1 Tax=Variovorax boronicumulans TaxID=436515 RepID=UPI00277DB947|nr:flagellar biosynthetic protein FliO [Variovorax boronicumulans]MDQ0086104.1 hypothetical protein [Variovorax boronicumulans]